MIEGRSFEKMMENSYSGLKSVLSADTVLGSPIVTNDGVSLIPICRITMGFLTGGGEITAGGYSDYPFAGGSGTGMSINPVGFLVCDKTKVKLISLEEKGIAEYIAKTVPDILRAVMGKKDEKENNC